MGKMYGDSPRRPGGSSRARPGLPGLPGTPTGTPTGGTSRPRKRPSDAKVAPQMPGGVTAALGLPAAALPKVR